MSGSTSRDSTSLIRAAGLRVTRQRVAVLDAVVAGPHMSTAAIFSAVSATVPGVSQQAVYDCLADLTDAGLTRRFVVDGRAALYETRTYDDHHHFVCRACALVIDVDGATGGAPFDIVDAAIFAVDATEIVYRGLCRPCAEARPAVVAPFPPSRLSEEHSNG